jgi:hypothetical protein
MLEPMYKINVGASLSRSNANFAGGLHPFDIEQGNIGNSKAGING